MGDNGTIVDAVIDLLSNLTLPTEPPVIDDPVEDPIIDPSAEEGEVDLLSDPGVAFLVQGGLAVTGIFCFCVVCVLRSTGSLPRFMLKMCGDSIG